MVQNEFTIIKGLVAFIYGVFGSVLSWYIVPIFFSVIPEDSTILYAGAWAGLIIIWILAVAVRPIYIIRKALQN